MPCSVTHGRLPGVPPASRQAGVQPRQQSGPTCQPWAKASRSTVAAASGWPRASDGVRANACTTGRTQRCPSVMWNPGERLTARASISVPASGAPITNTGLRTLRPLTTRMCGRAADGRG